MSVQSKLDENNIKQFFLDVGFLSQDGMPTADELFPDALSTSGEDEDDGYSGIQDNIKDLLYKDQDGDVALFADFFLFNDPGTVPSHAQVPYQRTTNQNVDYQKKDLKQTHSFSDIHLEDLEQPRPEFPRHVGSRSTMEPSALEGEE